MATDMTNKPRRPASKLDMRTAQGMLNKPAPRMLVVCLHVQAAAVLVYAQSVVRVAPYQVDNTGRHG